MAKIAGLFLRSTDTFIRFLELLGSAAILGIFSYFLACLARGGLPIATWMRAVEGISGAGVLYTLFGVVLTFFLGGVTIFALLGILLDLAFCGAFAYVAYATRGGIHCGGDTNEAFFGNGNTGIGNSSATPRVICDLEKTCFILAIILCGLFLLSAVVQLALWLNHKKEKKYGPGPSNNYTSGSGKRSRFGRKNKASAVPVVEKTPVNNHARHADRDLELGATDMRPSADTAVDSGAAYGGSENKYFKDSHQNPRSETFPEPTVPAVEPQNRQTRRNEGYGEGNMRSAAVTPAAETQPALNSAAVHLEPPSNTDAEWVHQVSNNPNNVPYGGTSYPSQNTYGRVNNY
ncbi:hypothetical protein MMC17_009518 [Xylographa soralifera]|nr:hypothetical protein [Xylographa soralifera]